MTPIESILDAARWAPSGDNTQPWRFRMMGNGRVAIEAFDTRSHCVYDLDGHASQLAVGALLETIRLAATGYGLAATWRRREGSPDDRPVFEVELTPDPSAMRSPLVDAIRERRVQRRPMRRRSLGSEATAHLEASLPPGYRLLVLGGRDRWAMAKLLFRSAKIRLTTREAFEVHSRVIEWGARFSEDRIPDEAVGLNPVATRMMRWAMRDWRRVQILNTYFAGTLLPRLELDVVPALACAAHVLILASDAPQAVEDYVAAGTAVQRFWLTATAMGLHHQPEMTPVIFSRYVREGRRFTLDPSALDRAREINRRLSLLVGDDPARRAVWMGRIGWGPPATARSLRLPLDQLMRA